MCASSMSDGGEAATAPMWAGRLALGSGVVVFDGPGGSARRHRHDATQLVIGRDAPIELRIERQVLRSRAAVLASRTPHGLDSTGRIVVMLVEPSGDAGRAFDAFAQAHLGVDLFERLGALVAPPDGDATTLVRWSRAVLDALTGRSGRVDLAGSRRETRQVVRLVDDRLDTTVRLGDMVGSIGLSERHLRRVLNDDLGMPFRRYVLWRRLRRAVLEVRRGRDLTTAAATAGFSDSAHFSRVFRSMFGLTPSEVLPMLDISPVELDPDR